MWLVDSAFARFWWILRRGLAHYRLGKSLRPRLENPQNHRKILESCGVRIQNAFSVYDHRHKTPFVMVNYTKKGGQK